MNISVHPDMFTLRVCFCAREKHAGIRKTLELLETESCYAGLLGRLVAIASGSISLHWRNLLSFSSVGNSHPGHCCGDLALTASVTALTWRKEALNR